MTVRVRPATDADATLIHEFVVALAAHQGGREQVTGTPQMLRRALFGDDPIAEALIAEALTKGDDRGDVATATAVGFALFHRDFSTWECRPGLWLEDLYVAEHDRRLGAGRALLTELARLTVARGYARLEWHARSWNEPALRLYAQLGADVEADERLHRLTGAALRRAAGNE